MVDSKEGWGGAVTLKHHGSDSASDTSAKQAKKRDGDQRHLHHASPSCGPARKFHLLDSHKAMAAARQNASAPTRNELEPMGDEDDQSLALRIFGIGKGRNSMEPSRIVHPFSPAAQTLTLISTVFLGYVAVVTPVMIAYYWSMDDCWRSPTLKVGTTYPGKRCLASSSSASGPELLAATDHCLWCDVVEKALRCISP